MKKDLIFSLDLKDGILVSGGADDIANIFNLGTYSPKFTLKGHTDTI